jgi:hypothetical protein
MVCGQHAADFSVGESGDSIHLRRAMGAIRTVRGFALAKVTEELTFKAFVGHLDEFLSASRWVRLWSGVADHETIIRRI